MDNTNSKKIWVFCFEYAGIAKVGGLGEVSANQCRSLAPDPNLMLEVFMPSYNLHKRLEESHNFSPLKNKNGETLVLKGHFDPAYFGITNTNEMHKRSFTKFQTFTDIGYFEVEIWQGLFNGVSINLLVGKNTIASTILNDSDVYGLSTLNARLGLFSHCMREFMRYCIYSQESKIPDIIHVHDHHPVAAFLCCRQELLLKGMDIKSIITMHLLTWPRRDLEFFWKSGVNNEPMLIKVGIDEKYLGMNEIYDIAKGKEKISPTLERIGCIISDKVIAVSENFLHSDIIPNCGGSLIEFKSDFTWNGCDWDYEKHKRIVIDQTRVFCPDKEIDKIYSFDFRKPFLKDVLGNLPEGEPRIKNSEIRSFISEQFDSPPYRSNCSVDAFSKDGPLVLVTGRVSSQKGIENIFSAIPSVIQAIPNVKFLFLMIPTPYTLEDLRNYIILAKKYPKNVRMVFGIASSVYLLAHLSADVYCCPSRWEPFGIVALEAMASKIPVVATYVGGLQESILHLEKHTQDGTGLLCPNNDIDALKHALISLLSVMIITEKKVKHPYLTIKDFDKELNVIVHSKLKNLISKDLLFGNKIRDNCLRRVEDYFRWKKVSEKLKKIYTELK